MPSLKELAWQSARIGVLGFGGPAGQIALMHRIFVDEKKWIGEERYLHALNYCMLLPGPEAQQLAVYAGWILNGIRGGLIAGALFFIPGAFVMLALSWLYAVHAETPAVAALFFGVKAAVLAIVAEAVVRIGKRALSGENDFIIAAAAFAALFFFGVPFPFVILAALLLGLLSASENHQRAISHTLEIKTSFRTIALTVLACAGLWFLPVILSFGIFGEDHVLTRAGVLFSKLAMVTFGGAYAVLAYLQQQAVEAQGWLTAAQMIDGLGLAETTPGPLVLVNQHVGFLAGWNAGGGLPMALAAAFMASWCTFAPSYLWIFAGAPFAERLRNNARAAGALRGVTAAVLGVVTSLALWFAMHVLFAETIDIPTPAFRSLSLPVLSSFDLYAALIAFGAAIALIRFKANMIAVIAACAAAGAVRFLV